MIESRRVARRVVRFLGDVRPCAEERVVYRVTTEREREALAAAVLHERTGAYGVGVRLDGVTWTVLGGEGDRFELVRLLPLPSAGSGTAWTPPRITSSSP